MRVKIRSIGPSLTRLAGTKLPHSASKTISAVWRMYVDLPPIFGPVIISILRSRLDSGLTSLSMVRLFMTSATALISPVRIFSELAWKRPFQSSYVVTSPSFRTLSTRVTSRLVRTLRKPTVLVLSTGTMTVLSVERMRRQ